MNVKYRRHLIAAAASIWVLITVCGAALSHAAAYRVSSQISRTEYSIRITGPAQVHPGDEIQIVVTGSGDAASGTVEVAGLEIVSVSGGFSSPTKYVCMGDLGGLVSTYHCRVTGSAGSMCAFGLSSPTVSDPQLLADVEAACDKWSRAVGASVPAVPTPAAPTDASAAEQPAPNATLVDALADAAAQLSSIWWDDISADYVDIAYDVVTGNAYLAQFMSWRDYSDFMFDNGFVILPFGTDGNPIELDDQERTIQATGQHIFVADRDTGAAVALQDMVMLGDVTGQGSLGISQLVRLAQAVTGRSPLIGLHRQAGDLNRNGRIDLGDLTCLAAWLRGRFLELPA